MFARSIVVVWHFIYTYTLVRFQVKKVIKWVCKVCSEKQSVTKVRKTRKFPSVKGETSFGSQNPSPRTCFGRGVESDEIPFLRTLTAPPSH